AVPDIAMLEAIPVSPGEFAPATYHIRSKVQNAKACVWDFGDDRPLEILTDALENQDRLVTFKEPGGYVIKLAAVNGNQGVQKSDIVNVQVPPNGTITAILSVTDQATRVETVETPTPVSLALPPNPKEATQPINRQLYARRGFTILRHRLES